MIDGFKTLKLKIDYLQHLVDSKQNDIDNLKEAFASNVKYYNNLVEKQKLILEKLKSNLNGMQTLDIKEQKLFIDDLISSGLNEQQQAKIMNISLSSTPLPLISIYKTATSQFNHDLSMIQDVSFPQISDFLKHLQTNSTSSSVYHTSSILQPRFKLSKNRFASIVIGIPTIKREKTSYLLETLKSLFDAMNDLEKMEALVVVIIPEVINFLSLFN